MMQGVGFEPTNPLRDRVSYEVAHYSSGAFQSKPCSFGQALIPLQKRSGLIDY